MDETERNLNFRMSREVQEALRNIREVAQINIPKVLAKKLEQARKAANLPVQDANLKMVKAMQATKIVDELSVLDIAKKNEKLVQNLISQQQKFAKKLQVNHFDAVRAISQSMSRIKPALSVLQEIQSINIQEFEQTSPDDFDNSYLNEAEEGFFQKLYLYFAKVISKLPKGRITANGIVQIYSAVISTILLLHTISQSKLDKKTSTEIHELNKNQNTTNELLEDISKLGNNIYPLINDLAETQQKEIIFATKKEAPIRKKPTSKSDTLNRISSNQEIEILKSTERWYYIKYYDFEESIPKMGYIYKGNVNKLDY